MKIIPKIQMVLSQLHVMKMKMEVIGSLMNSESFT